MSDELIPVQPVVEVEPKPFNVSEEVRKAIAKALNKIENRPFSDRHPELGKMVNCKVCGTRHRLNERKCVQVFTHRIKDYLLFRQDEQGNEAPDYRTCTPEGERPTIKQIMGAAMFAKKRFHPHPSKIKLLLIQKTRAAFERLGFELVDEKDEAFMALTPDEKKAKVELFQKNLQRARVVAAREIRKERELSDREYRRRADQARRINRGLKVTVRA
jgi:hypothetical protein